MSAAYLRGPDVPAVVERHASCVGKHRYNSAELARGVAARAKARVNVYRCVFCRAWHIGRVPAGGFPTDAARAEMIRAE